MTGCSPLLLTATSYSYVNFLLLIVLTFLSLTHTQRHTHHCTHAQTHADAHARTHFSLESFFLGLFPRPYG